MNNLILIAIFILIISCLIVTAITIITWSTPVFYRHYSRKRDSWVKENIESFEDSDQTDPPEISIRLLKDQLAQVNARLANLESENQRLKKQSNLEESTARTVAHY